MGLGCANCVPVLFATSVKVEGVASSAIALVGRLGYLGILVGPVIVGFTAHHQPAPGLGAPGPVRPGHCGGRQKRGLGKETSRAMGGPNLLLS